MTGVPGPTRTFSQRTAALSSRTQPWEVALPSTPPTFISPCRAIWPGPPAELL
ncbi:MAG TPA: hypothetical protein VIL73_08485 [Gaiellaceae bacterium]